MLYQISNKTNLKLCWENTEIDRILLLLPEPCELISLKMVVSSASDETNTWKKFNSIVKQCSHFTHILKQMTKFVRMCKPLLVTFFGKCGRYIVSFKNLEIESRVCRLLRRSFVYEYTIEQFYIPMPLLTESFQRIFIGKIWDEESYDLKSVFTNLLILREIMSRHDYSVEEIFIMDMSHSSMKFITKFRANIMADGVPLVLKCYSARIKQIHLISKFASTIMNWMKPILPSKIASRFRAHESVETLSEHIGAKYLPKDYGGDLKSLKEHLADFDEIYAKHKDQIIEYVKTSAREELRQGEPAPEDMQGTFLKLNID